jgi:uncharacterized membrane protein YeaQ/YmgE (transglycosylase-associated protein family)
VSLDLVLSILFTGLLVGALARLAVPGPDPMPLWLTVGIGLTGSIIGAVVAQTIFDDSSFALSLGSLVVATALVVAYRRFVQHRPVWGPEALRFPERGVGVAEQRDRLRKLGIDPNRLGPAPPPAAPPAAAGDPADHLLTLLSELHREGVLDDSEYAAKRELVESRHRRSAT